MFAGGAAAEIAAHGQDGSGAHALDEVGVQAFHAVAAQITRLAEGEVASGQDDVGIHRVPEAVDTALDDHAQALFSSMRPTSSGGTISPVTAAAAATQVLDRK